ncbi:pre-rRNA-processing protein esf2, putative [Entamoeba invadens IP1]|uniref:pre-rRNA-processing protein esf2, putative n=1 Tax=Entamoeba invadens IP1 TaxID=370355 RepID=UPI0002C3D78C|nr:pre-rRNA-processing protein esf2, putative [Entamoeba invadens IP1]ELP85320.1 pre-rRNA-processing protein esf2, putative [Entamoeba invadens IP1]|eukprot:XP_004184666.1 pre-rRNA-processing protein esf2, putative [Entamoeba invadens IP1]
MDKDLKDLLGSISSEDINEIEEDQKLVENGTSVPPEKKSDPEKVGNVEPSQKIEKVEKPQKTKLKGLQSERGIVYLSSIPRGITMVMLKSMMSTYKPVTRMYVVEGNTRFVCKEGWFEYATHKDAKLVEYMMNGQQVGGNRHKPYSTQLWNIKYIPDLVWTKIFEDTEAKDEMREHQIDSSLRKVKRENEAYMKGLSHVYKVKKMNKKKLKEQQKKEATMPRKDN